MNLVDIIKAVSDKKYIFFDIDGTILTDEGVVLESTKKALKLAQENGHEIFVNTGRCKNIIPKEIISLDFDGIVCGTGTQAEYHGKHIFDYSFSEEQINRVVKMTHENNIPIIMSSCNECVATSTDLPVFIELFSKGKIKAKDFTSVEDIAGSPLLESMRPIVIDEDKPAYGKKYKGVTDFIFINSPFNVDEFNQKIGDDIRIDKASFKDPDDFSGEITVAAHSKKTGIANLLKSIGGDIKDSIAIGDGYNDIDMFNGAHLSIAMGNSPQDIKDMADHVTDDILKDGVLKALRHFDLI